MLETSDDVLKVSSETDFFHLSDELSTVIDIEIWSDFLKHRDYRSLECS